MTTSIRYHRLFVAIASVAIVLATAIPSHSQHLENRATGSVKNSGTIRFKSDTGQYKNAAPFTAITNNVIEFAGTNNLFTDLDGFTGSSTVLGQDPTWRVPGLVRYKKTGTARQNLQPRYYTNLENADEAPKWIPDSVFVGGEYLITLSGPRTYNGTFTYDGSQPQYITSERGMSGNVNRYNNMTIRNSVKSVRDSDEVRMDGIFTGETSAPLRVFGEFYWGSDSYAFANIEIDTVGRLETGRGVSFLHEDVSVRNGDFVIPQGSDTVFVMSTGLIVLRNADTARLVMGARTRLDILGEFRNEHPPLVNVSFDSTSLVHYTGTQSPQIMQATVGTHPYGNLMTSKGVKGASGDVHVYTDLTVNDTNIVMIPHTMSMTTGRALYTNLAEVVGRLRRDLRRGDTSVTYVYNNEETFFNFITKPDTLTLDSRPQTRPNAYDPTTDVFRKLTVTASGEWQALVRAGYKETDIPSPWDPTASERLLKMYNAYPAPNERALKLTPTLPPTYNRRSLAQSSGIAYVELFGISRSGVDNIRLDDGNDLLLRGSRDTLRAIASGRWSNPFTWDEAREPEPIDRVIIDGFTVHVGYVRASDNYAVAERYPDSLSQLVIVGAMQNSSLLFGSTGTFNTFSYVPATGVDMRIFRQAPALVPTLTQDVTATDIDGGLVVYPSSSITVTNLLLGADATVFNAGRLRVGIP